MPWRGLASVTEKKIAVGPSADRPNTAARSTPARIHDRFHLSGTLLQVGVPETGSERPAPALSKINGRANEATRPRNDFTAGAQKNSMWETNDGMRR